MAGTTRRSTKQPQARKPKAPRPLPEDRLAFRLALPRCECRHVNGLGEESACEERAAFRVTVVCLVEGCECGATVYLLCHECVEVWQERAAGDPNAPELRITPF